MRVQFLEVVIPGHAIPKQSVKFRVVQNEGRKPWVQTYQPASVRHYQTNARKHFSDHWKSPRDDGAAVCIEGPLDLDICIWVLRPRTKSVRRFPYPDVQPDLDNYEKPITDALADAGVIRNDGQIVSKKTAKRYAPAGCAPCVVATLWRTDCVEFDEWEYPGAPAAEVEEPKAKLKRAPRRDT